MSAPDRERPDCTMKTALNVLAVIDHLALGGAEVMLGRFAAAAPEAGIRLSVTCITERDGNPAAELLRAVGIEPVVLSFNHLRLGELRELKRHIAEVQPDIVHTHLGSSDFLGGLAAHALGVPAVSTIHAMAWGGNMRSRIKTELTARAAPRRRAHHCRIRERAARVPLAQMGAGRPCRDDP
jgi:hypothetical protein